MISLIIPTMWKHKPFLEFLKNLVEIECIGEIIIINNSVEDTPKDPIFSHTKIIMHNSETNLFVAPSWNLGAKLAKYINMGFLSDDVFVDTRVFEKVDNFINNEAHEDIGMIGLVIKYKDNTDYDDAYTDGSINIIQIDQVVPTIGKRLAPVGIGCLFFMRKQEWKDIPQQVKIFHGEVLQWNRLAYANRKNYYIYNCFAQTPWHITWNALGVGEENWEKLNILILEDQHYCESVNFTFN
jgi:GT2 family glycosyltransferase